MDRSPSHFLSFFFTQTNTPLLSLLYEQVFGISAVYDFSLTSKWDPSVWVPLACEREVIYSGSIKSFFLLYDAGPLRLRTQK